LILSLFYKTYFKWNYVFIWSDLLSLLISTPQIHFIIYDLLSFFYYYLFCSILFYTSYFAFSFSIIYNSYYKCDIDFLCSD
jgi:hypothetical protein